MSIVSKVDMAAVTVRKWLRLKAIRAKNLVCYEFNKSLETKNS